VKYNSFADPAEWITLKVFKSSHQKAATHLRAVNLKEEVEVEHTRRLQDAPDFFATSNNIDFMAPSPQALGCPLSHDPMQDLWDEFEGTFGLDDRMDEVHETECKKFDVEAQEYGLWDGLEQMSTGTNMINVEESWDEEEQDDLLLELLEHIGWLLNLMNSNIELIIN